MAILATGRPSLERTRRGLAGMGGRRSRLGASSAWRRYREVVEQREANGRYTIWLKEAPGYSIPSGLGAITSQESGLLSTGASVGTSVGLASTIGAWAGPVGAAAGALVGIIAGLFAASAARAKGAKTENAAINEYLPSWDSGMQQIFAAANAGTATTAECVSAVAQLMSQWWQAAAQFHGLPGVADASNGGSNCGTYTSGVTTPCTPSGGPGCNKSCTAFCCVGCHDLMPSAQDAISVLQKPGGGSVNVCTVYGSSYGAMQRNQYTLTYTPPPPPPAAVATGSAAPTSTGVATSAPAVASSATTTILGLPWYLVVGGGVAAFLALR